MTMTIDFAPQTEDWLNAQARKLGTQPVEVVRKLVEEHAFSPANSEAIDDPTLRLFAQWDQEDSVKSPEDLADDSQMWEEFERGINASRKLQGMRQL